MLARRRASDKGGFSVRRSHALLRTTIALAASALALSPVLGLSAGASGPGSTTLVPVSQGIDVTAIPGAQAFTSTPASTPEEVSFIMNDRNLSQLQQSVERGVGSFLSVAQFTQQYGQTQSAITQLQTYLAGFGISTTVYPDNLDVSATGTAGEFNRALSVVQSEYHVPKFSGYDGRHDLPAQTIHGTSTNPQLPSQLAQNVLAILGLTNYGPFTSQAVHVDSAVAQPQSKSASACVALTGLPNACNLPSDFESNYGLTSLEHSGALGNGQTIGIVTLASMDPGAPQYFWSNIVHLASTARKVTTENIDGGSGAPSDASGSGETDLDVEQSGGIAPDASVIVYQAPNTDYGFADAFFQAASENVASSISSSWGESETLIQSAVASGLETPAYQAAFDEAFLEMAAQGQSGFVSAGDSGAYDASADLGTTNLSVDAPGDSPFITTAGGTTLPFSATITSSTASATIKVSQQRAWGWDYLWQPLATVTGQTVSSVAESYVVGGGGGFSALEPSPSYQQGVSGTSTYSGVQYLTPTTFVNEGGVVEPTAWSFNASPNIVQGRGSGRALPDLATDADPNTGYLEYSPSFLDTGGPELEGGWGGTSFVAPQLNGATAVIDSYLGHRVGFWNPSIYGFATSKSSPFTPLQQVGTSNDNVFYTGNPGTVFNEATGLGVPNLAVLARDFGH